VIVESVGILILAVTTFLVFRVPPAESATRRAP
jgi:hypothetical protein